jgi:TolB-like protein
MAFGANSNGARAYNLDGLAKCLLQWRCAMRTLIRFFAAICVIAAPLLADGPTTTPSASVAAPTVLIFPFQPMGQLAGREWVRSALQEEMVADVNKTGLVQTRSMLEPLVSTDSAKAIAAGKDAGAAMVIFGNYQIVGDQIRVTGQMTQVPSRNVVTTLQATGIVVDIFRVENTLAAQIDPTIMQLFRGSQREPVVVFGTPTGMYFSSGVNVQPLQSGPLEPEYYSGPSSGNGGNFPYIYSPGYIFSSGLPLGNRLDYGPYNSYNYGYNHGGFHGSHWFGGWHHGR